MARHFLRNNLVVEITCADMTRMFKSLSDKGIVVYDIINTGILTVEIEVGWKSLKEIIKIVEKFGGHIKVKRVWGIRPYVGWFIKRRIIAIAILVLGLFLSVLPSRVFFVCVEGNTMVPTKRILEAADKCGLSFGSLRRAIRSEKIKNSLLEELPQLQWAGINTSGCVATISVKERGVGESEQEFPGIGNIIAARDGIIQNYAVENGTAICRIGEAVTAGQVLVSGYIDCGGVIKCVCAQAEVNACTVRDIDAVTPATALKRQLVVDEKTTYSILLGKKLINLYKDSGILDTSCVKMYSERYLTLPGGFQLPIALVTHRLVSYSTAICDVSSSCEWLPKYCETYLREHMVAGQILSKSSWTETDNGTTNFHGEYICLEMIGQFVGEENLSDGRQTD